MKAKRLYTILNKTGHVVQAVDKIADGRTMVQGIFGKEPEGFLGTIQTDGGRTEVANIRKRPSGEVVVI